MMAYNEVLEEPGFCVKYQCCVVEGPGFSGCSLLASVCVSVAQASVCVSVVQASVSVSVVQASVSVCLCVCL